VAESNEPGNTSRLQLAYPIYLDTGMCLAFAAALSGGVALESESVEAEEQLSRTARKLKGSIRILDALGVGGERGTEKGASERTESRSIRSHTEASIFITLLDELKRTGEVIEDEDRVASATPGDFIAVKVGPAVAPLKRVVDQILRLLELTDPDTPTNSQGSNRQQRRHGPVTTGDSSLTDAKTLFRALKGDLDHSGMTDVVIRREGSTGLVLTLDDRYIEERTLELLHTSTFTVFGKVTHRWEDDDAALLYRRSVISLIPSLASSVAWILLGTLGSIAKSIDPMEAQRAAAAVSGVAVGPSDEDVDASGEHVPKPEELLESSEADVQISKDVEGLYPALGGPALQILPLAICT
jgi:hypothetical protein